MGRSGKGPVVLLDVKVWVFIFYENISFAVSKSGEQGRGGNARCSLCVCFAVVMYRVPCAFLRREDR